MMIDTEKAIGNLQILRTWCAVNPRYSKGLDAGDCEKAVGWLDDALELLKEQGPIRRGRWIPHITEDGYKSGYDCSVCGVWIVMPNGLRKYCPDCGALMGEGEME